MKNEGLGDEKLGLKRAREGEEILEGEKVKALLYSGS